MSPSSVISFFPLLDCQLSADWLVFSSKCSLYISFSVCDSSWTFFINYSLNKSGYLYFPCNFVPFCRKMCTLFQGVWWAPLGCQIIAHQLCSCRVNTFAIGCLLLCWLHCSFLYLMTLICGAPGWLPVPLSQQCLSCAVHTGLLWAVVHCTALLLLLLFIQTLSEPRFRPARPLHSGYSTFLCRLLSYFALL